LLNTVFKEWVNVKGLIYFFFPFYLILSVLSRHQSQLFAVVMALLGLSVFWRFKQSIHNLPIKSYEKYFIWVLIAYCLVSVASFFYWPITRDAHMRVEDDLKFLVFIPLFLILREIRFERRYLISLIVLFAMVMGCVSFGQYFKFEFIADIYGYSQRPSADVNPMRYAVIAILMASFCLSAWIAYSGKTKLCKGLFLVAMLFGVAACILTQTRGVWLSIPCLLILFLFYLIRVGAVKHVKVLSLAVVGILLAVLSTEIVQNRIEVTINNLDRYQQGSGLSSLGVRLDMYKASLMLMEEKPVFGHGLGVFQQKSKELRASGALGMGVHEQVGIRRTPHNEFFQAIVERGLLGLLVTILIFVFPWIIFYRAIWCKNEDSVFYGLSGLSLLLVFFVAGQTGTLFNHNVFTNFYLIMVMLFVSQIRQVSPEVLD